MAVPESRTLPANLIVSHEIQVTLALAGDEYTGADLAADLAAANINAVEGIWYQMQTPDSEANPYASLTKIGRDLSAVNGVFLTGFSQGSISKGNLATFKIRAKVANVVFTIEVLS